MQNAKPDGSVSNINATTAQQLIVASEGGIETNMHNFLLRGKPFEALGSMAGLNKPLVVISQEETDYSAQIQNEASTSRGVASETSYGSMGNGTAEATFVNNLAVPTTEPVSSLPSQDFSLNFYQQQIMLNHQMFLQQQQTINALMGKVEGLTKDAANKMSALTDGHTVTPMQNRINTVTKAHVLSDVSSDSDHSSSEGGYNSDQSDDRPSTFSVHANSIRTNAVNQSGEVETNDNMKLLKDLGKELEKSESVANNVDDTLAQVVNINIRSQIDRNVAKELCAKYQRPGNCSSLVVPKINKELWNNSSISKNTKEQDRMYQTAQKYLTQGLIPLVQLLQNMLKDKEPENFKLARDSFQMLAYAHRDLSNLRRQRLKMVVAEKYRPLCNDSTTLSENLLGDDLEKQIRTLDEMRKVGKDLTKRPEKRKYNYKQEYEKPSNSKYPKHSHQGFRTKDKGSFLDRKPRFQKPGPHRHNKRSQKQL